MTTFQRNLHRISVAVQAFCAAAFLWVGLDAGSAFCLAMAGWCAWWCAYSYNALRADRKKGVEA